MKGLDDYIEGKYDPFNPANQPDYYLSLTIEELIEEGDIDAAIKELSGIRLVIDRLRQISKTSDNRYFYNQLTQIYNKL